MLTWISSLSPRVVDAALTGLRQLHQRKLDVPKARHDHDVRVKALVLEHEQDHAAVRAVAPGKPSPYARPEKGCRTNERLSRTRKRDLDFER